MRHGLALMALLLPLAGCVVPPGGYGDDGGYPGYSYNGGSPSYVVGGVRQPLVYYGGSWGYYDSNRRFQRAPDNVHRHLETRHPAGGGGYRPFFGGGYSRPAETPHYGTTSGGYRPASSGYSGYRAPPPAYAAPRTTYSAPRPTYAAPQHTSSRPASAPASGTHRRRDDDRR